MILLRSLRAFQIFKLCIAVLNIVLVFSSCAKEEDEYYAISPNSIVIVPDIQIYTKTSNSVYLRSIVNFINKNKHNISVCLQTGDLTNNNMPNQWENVFNEYINRIDPEISHYECLGNHDYGENGLSNDRYSNIYWDLCYNSEICYGGYHENYVQFAQIGDKQYGILVLEFAVRAKTLSWAQQILKQYVDTNFIVLTHAFLNSEGRMYSDSTILSDYDNPQFYDIASVADYRNSEQIFKSLSETNPNLKVVICGHSLPQDGFQVSKRIDSKGRSVILLMVNFQHFPNGGGGNIAILNLEEQNKSLSLYSTISEKCLMSLIL